MYDRLTGEVLPSPEEFKYTELAAIVGDKFYRNIISGSALDTSEWRIKHNNTGLFRSVLSSQEPDFLNKYYEAGTLFYGDLCFDFDVNKDDQGKDWEDMLEEVIQKLVPVLRRDFELPAEAIRIWFSGSRGLHIEVPAATIGVFPHPHLYRAFGAYAKAIKDEWNMRFLDLSLYGGKHLYRLEGSIHQRSGLYKWPMKVGELKSAKNLEVLQVAAKRPRDSHIWMKKDESSPKSRGTFDAILKGLLERKVEKTYSHQGDRAPYDRSKYHCISTLFSDNYTEHGNRNTTAFLLASHLRQNGFTYDEAQKEIGDWASNHCDPPFTSPADTLEWKRALVRVYEAEDPPHAGCTFIQNTLPSLCQEKLCPIGLIRIARRNQE